MNPRLIAAAFLLATIVAPGCNYLDYEWDGSPAKEILTGEGRGGNVAIRAVGSVYDSSAVKVPGETWKTADNTALITGVEYYGADEWSWTASVEAREYGGRNGTELHVGSRYHLPSVGLILPFAFAEVGTGVHSAELDSTWVTVGAGMGVKVFATPTIAFELGLAYERFLLAAELDPFSEGFDARNFLVTLGLAFHF